MNNENDSEILKNSEDHSNKFDTDGSEKNSDAPSNLKSDNTTIEENSLENEAAAVDLPQEKDTLAVTKIIFEYLELFVCSICVVLLVFMFSVRLCDVRGSSMEQTLYEGEKLLISNLFYTPERGDIIVFHQTGNILNEPVVKRVIATGGETVTLEFQPEPQSILLKIYDENMHLVEELDESAYVYYDGTDRTAYKGQIVTVYVPEGYLFVMGDNRNNSTDSRSEEIGLVDERRVLGRVIVRIFPFSKIGAVE